MSPNAGFSYLIHAYIVGAFFFVKCQHRASVLFLLVLLVFDCVLMQAQDRLEISEFMAKNETGLDDQDRDEEDWIEIHNAGLTQVNLDGWFLTDKADDLSKWRFPAVTLAPDAYLLVFASEKDLREPGGELHTNFKLRGQGEYLGLVQPDELTVVSAFAPAYPLQAPDVSYGLRGARTEEMILPQGMPARALVPGDDVLEPENGSGAVRPWTSVDLDDSLWERGTTGVGYGYPGLIGLDVSAMRSVNETVYIRVPFEIDNPAAIKRLTLRMRYEDGMIAYINGQEVARANAPASGTETWNSGASVNRSEKVAVNPVDIEIADLSFLRAGINLLAIQGLNNRRSKSDLLIIPELLATIHEQGTRSLRYFPRPTPGTPNNAGIKLLGPIIEDMAHSPDMPIEGEDLALAVQIKASFAPVASATLHYRVMFGQEFVVPLLDNGQGNDADGGGGTYGAQIPGSAVYAGQMLRWYITAQDSMGRISRFPPHADPENSPQYAGTVAWDPSLINPLPALHWFIQNPAAANNTTGTRCSLFYGGAFYDNLHIYIHGQSSRGFPKKSYNIDLHPGHNFRWAPDEPRADDINLMTTYPDKAQMRNILAYETYQDADCPYHWVLPVRVQQNAEFWGTAHIMENGDEDWLVRMGVNVQGALYKMYNRFTSAGDANSGAEKKTRKYEGNADLAALYNGISLSGEARRRYLYDNVDVAQVVNFLAARAITGDTDCCHKNYYFYRDTGVSNEWQMWPWDVDLSFGRRWIGSHTYWDNNLIANTPLFVGSNNSLPQAIFNTSETRQMYLRRIRTLMDELLKPPGTPLDQLHYEPRMDELAGLIAPDAALDAAKWNSHAWGNGSTAPCCPQSLMEAVAEMKNVYLPERRDQLYNGKTSGARELPDAQPENTIVFIGDIDVHPLSADPEEEYIQLQNYNAFAVDISGWTLSGSVRFVFRGGTVIPAQGTLYVAANRLAFRARTNPPMGAQALFVVGDYTGRLAQQADTLALIDRQGRTVASVDDIESYTPLAPPTPEPLPEPEPEPSPRPGRR
jgi:hypothetical protein